MVTLPSKLVVFCQKGEISHPEQFRGLQFPEIASRTIHIIDILLDHGVHDGHAIGRDAIIEVAKEENVVEIAQDVCCASIRSTEPDTLDNISIVLISVRNFLHMGCHMGAEERKAGIMNEKGDADTAFVSKDSSDACPDYIQL
jgi:hypothetical protein